MKKRLIKTLKNEILVIETPEETYFEVFKHGIYFKDHLNADRGFIEGSYTLLGSPDEIKEEDAKELVEETEMGVKLNSKKYKYRAYDSQLGYATATESLLSALESEIYWDVNPFESKADFLVSDNSANGCALYRKAFHEFCEAQEKTFDKKRVKIFVKN